MNKRHPLNRKLGRNNKLVIKKNQVNLCGIKGEEFAFK